MAKSGCLANSILFCSVFCLLVSCGGGGSSSGGGSASLATEMTRFLGNSADQAFFADEAARAGVRTIRTASASDALAANVCAQSVIGPDEIIINTANLRPGGLCVGTDVATLIGHEIAHFGAKRTCSPTFDAGGHGPPFWDYFRGIARRYIEGGINGNWQKPLGQVARNQQGYVDNGIPLLCSS